MWPGNAEIRDQITMEEIMRIDREEEHMHIHYLEIVTQEMDAKRAIYKQLHGLWQV